MKEKQMNKWASIRTKGKRRYILLHGIIGWGIPTAILYATILSFFDQGSLGFFEIFLDNVVKAIIIFPIVGIFFGIWTWRWFEKLYRQSENTY